MSSQVEDPVTDFISLYLTQLPEDLSPSVASKIFRPFGFLLSGVWRPRRAYTSGHLCVINKATAERLQQEFSSKRYRLGLRTISAQGLGGYSITHRKTAKEMKESMPNSLQDWPKALKDFQDAVEVNYGYTVFIKNIARSTAQHDLQEIFKARGKVKSWYRPNAYEGRPVPWCLGLYGSKAEAEKAVSTLHGSVLHGQELCVEHDVFGQTRRKEQVITSSPAQDHHPEGRPSEQVSDPKTGAGDIADQEKNADNPVDKPVLDERLDMNDGMVQERNQEDVSSEQAFEDALESPDDASSEQTFQDVIDWLDAREANDQGENSRKQEEVLDGQILRIGFNIIDLAIAIMDNQSHFIVLKQHYAVPSRSQIIQQMRTCADVREAIRQLLSNKSLIGRAL